MITDERHLQVMIAGWYRQHLQDASRDHNAGRHKMDITSRSALLLIPFVLIPSLLALAGSYVCAQDTITVRANNPPVWGENLRLVEEVRIGSLEGDEEYLFGSVGSVSVGLDGTIFVADWQLTTIKRFRADGEYLGRVGRRGGGPGEYLQISGTRTLPSGELTVWDQGNQRVSIYDGQGEYARSHRVLSGLHTLGVTFQVDTAAHQYVRAVAAGVTLRFGEEFRQVWIRVSPRGEIIDSIPIPLQERAGPSFVLATSSGRRRPFPEVTVSCLSPHGYLIVGRNDAYALHRPLPDGRILRIERDFEPVPVTPTERAQWEMWTRYTESRRSGGRVSITRLPDHKPPFRSFWADEEGRMWVSRYTIAEYHPHSPEEQEERAGRPDYEWREPPVWDVIDPRGTFLGNLTTPERSWIAAARGRHIWVVELGEFDEEYVVRYRIESGE